MIAYELKVDDELLDVSIDQDELEDVARAWQNKGHKVRVSEVHAPRELQLLVRLCQRLDAELDGVGVPQAAGAIMMVIRRMVSSIEL